MTHFLDLQHNIYKSCKCCVNVVGKGRAASKRGRKRTRKGKTQTENKEERQKWEDKKGRHLKEKKTQKSGSNERVRRRRNKFMNACM